jgi:hypothetical protein
MKGRNVEIRGDGPDHKGGAMALVDIRDGRGNLLRRMPEAEALRVVAVGGEPHRNQSGRLFRVDVSLPGSVFDASRTTKNALMAGRRIGTAHTQHDDKRCANWRLEVHQ